MPLRDGDDHAAHAPGAVSAMVRGVPGAVTPLTATASSIGATATPFGATAAPFSTTPTPASAAATPMGAAAAHAGSSGSPPGVWSSRHALFWTICMWGNAMTMPSLRNASWTWCTRSVNTLMALERTGST